MTVKSLKSFNELFAASVIKPKYEIYLNKELAFCGYLSDIPTKKKKAIFSAEIESIVPIGNDAFILHTISKIK